MKPDSDKAHRMRLVEAILPAVIMRFKGKPLNTEAAVAVTFEIANTVLDEHALYIDDGEEHPDDA